MTNTSGSWQVIGSNTSVYDGTYSQTPTTMDEYTKKYYWCVNVSDVGGNWTNVSYCFTTIHEPGGWWDSDWLYRKPIIIDHTLIDEALVNFPVLISSDSDGDLAVHAQDSGADLIFTDYDGNRLNHEIELFNHTDGQFIAWVNVTSLSADTDTVLYLYYGNSLCSSQENITGTWSSDYRMVQHLNETSGLHYDSTLYGNDGTNYGSIQDAEGKIDGGNVFNGTWIVLGRSMVVTCLMVLLIISTVVMMLV